mgnify:CR=1 FL=1
MSSSSTQNTASSKITLLLIVGVVATSIIAAAATAASLWLEVPLWMMFVGWVNFSSHGHGADMKTTYRAFLCLFLGILMGMGAHVVVHSLVPAIGLTAALIAVVFAIAFILLSFAHLQPSFHKVIAYYLGMISFFASELAISAETFITLSIGGILGLIAGWMSVNLQSRLNNIEDRLNLYFKRRRNQFY